MPILTRAVLVLLAALLAAGLPGEAHALSCSASISDIDFGSPDLLSSSPVDALATITVSCSSIPRSNIVKMCPGISDGSGGSSGSARLLVASGSSGATLSYQLFQDSSRTLGWGAIGQPQLGTVPVLTIGNGASTTAMATATIYVRLFGGQAGSPPGSYASSYTGTETGFTYAAYATGSNVSCTGNLGSTFLRPAFNVNARPAAGCGLTTADLTFPATGTLNSALTGQASLGVTCTKGTAYSLSLGNGATGTGPTARKMVAANGDSVTYGLYRNSARTQAWGAAAAGLAASGTGTGSGQSLTVYGQVPVQATPRPGSYSDRVVVTIAY